MYYRITIYVVLVLALGKNAQTRFTNFDVNLNALINRIDSVFTKDEPGVSNTQTISVINNANKSTSENEIIEDRITEKSDNATHKADSDNDKVEQISESALILTKLIEQGRIDEARNASRVDDSVFYGLQSYSGYLTVNKTYNSNLFFWYFPIENKPVNETPWIIWLQGGPGASSLSGLFDEIGPYTIRDGKLERYRFTWLRNHSLIFIDSPVGTGFSFTDHEDGYAKDMETYSLHLHLAVKQLLQIFPELKAAPLFIAGESYAGKYVPALAMEIHKAKNTPDGDINLKGLMIGNALIEPMMLSNMSRTFYKFGLIDQEQLDVVLPLQNSFIQDVINKRSIAAKWKFTWLVTLLLQLSQQASAYNFLSHDFKFMPYAAVLNSTLVKKALHVGGIRFVSVNATVNLELFPEFSTSTRPLFETLLEHYDVLAYCGHLDMMIPCSASSQEFRTWNWNSSSLFQNATRYPLIYKRRGVVGYYKTGGRLTEVLIKGAGHMAPKDQPAAVQNLVARWTSSLPLSDAQPSPSFDRVKIESYIKKLTTTVDFPQLFENESTI